MIAVNGQDVLTFQDGLALCKAHAQLELPTDEVGAMFFEEPYNLGTLVQELQQIRAKKPELQDLVDVVLEALGTKRSTDEGVYQHLEKADAHYAPQIQRSLKMMFSAKQVAKTKKAPKSLNTKALKDVFAQMYRDGYFVGFHFAHEQLPSKVKRAEKLKAKDIPPPDVSPINWDTWQPGNPEAAGVLGQEGPGLTGLLDDAGVTIKDISATTMQDIEDTLAYAIEQGSSAATIADALGEIVGPDRADLIANTELTRAVHAATEDTYNINGVTEFNWLPASDACPECEAMTDANPYDVGDDMPPLHPRCRCTVTPVGSSIGESGAALDEEE